MFYLSLDLDYSTVLNYLGQEQTVLLKFALCSAVVELIQSDVSQYPFHQQPPAYLRAHRYRYWFTESKADGSVLSGSPRASLCLHALKKLHWKHFTAWFIPLFHFLVFKKKKKKSDFRHAY